MSWMLPRTVEEALRLRADHPDATVVAGGTFLGILTRQGLLQPDEWLSLQDVPELRELRAGDELSVGAMVAHRRIELSPDVARRWPGLVRAFALVASPRVRNVATVGGVLADADYASDPPAMLAALGAHAEVASVRGTRRVPVDELIVGHYETVLEDDELILRVVVPPHPGPTAYRKLRTRSCEDRPAVAVAAARRDDHVRVVVGAVGDRPQHFPDVCAGWVPGDAASVRAVADGYAERIRCLDDARGSADYRRHAVAVEIRRALLELGA